MIRLIIPIVLVAFGVWFSWKLLKTPPAEKRSASLREKIHELERQSKELKDLVGEVDVTEKIIAVGKKIAGLREKLRTLEQGRRGGKKE